MILKVIDNFNSKYQVYFNKTIFLRVTIYFSIAAIFFYYMQTYSPYGINWTSYHYERLVNSVKNIFENTQLTLFGFTSWSEVNDVKSSLINNLEKIYIVPIITYILPAFFYKLFGNFDFLNYGSIFDYIFISYTGVLVSEIGILTISVKNKVDSIIYGSIIFSLFITSPWTYRMMLAPWHEVGFLGFYLTSIYLFIKNKKNLGLIFLFISLLINFEWGFLIFLFLILIMLINLVYKNVSKYDLKYSYLPNGLQNRNGFITYSCVYILSQILFFIQILGAKLGGVKTSNTGALYRIGIDSLDNIHHGGLLGAFQFLGGNRYSLCFDNISNLSGVDDYIRIFNCFLSITTFVVISIMSIIGLFFLFKKNPSTKWILQPLFWAFLFFNFVFQQSFAVHLQGHSYIFGFLFAIGFPFLLKNIFDFTKLSNISSNLILLPIVAGVLINSIRVCYLTGING